ncbi:Dishevelled associated activator of morphogenesis 2 [Nowakowskiella sp. JEL0407]|nr:Dishevelled associated activator of morphogenesis 2 [Nowakowskiella sp. JEL0407]
MEVYEETQPISSTKSSDGSKSLLSFLCELIQTRFPHLEQITTELKDIPAISKLSLNTIELIFTTEIQDTFTNEVLVSFEKVKKLDSQLDNNDRFIEVMQPFVALVQADIKSFKSKSASCLNLFKDVLSLYGEPVESAMAPEEFMLIFVEFLQSFEATMLENRKEMERKQKEEYLLNARKKRNITKNQSSNNNTPEPNNLLQTLKKGTLSKLENAQNTPAKQPGSFESSRKISTSLIHEQALEMLGEIQNEKQNESKNQILPLEDLLLPSLSTSMSFGEDFFKDILTVDEKCKDFM